MSNIDEIRKRHKAGDRLNAVEDRGCLLDWVKRLRVDLEIERMRLKEHQDEVERLRAEVERLRDVLRRISVQPSGDRIVKISFVSRGCTLTFPVNPQTTRALEILTKWDQARRKALEGAP